MPEKNKFSTIITIQEYPAEKVFLTESYKAKLNKNAPVIAKEL